MDFKEYLISEFTTINDALKKINYLSEDATIFVINEVGKLVGSVTDGDIRRGIIHGISVDDVIIKVAQKNPKYINTNKIDVYSLKKNRENNIKLMPVVDDNNIVINIINFRILKSYLPVDTIIMAGGKGSRLKPLTDKIPKPLLKIGEKTIIEHNLDRISRFGIENLWITINYLGNQIEKKINKNSKIKFIRENKPLGTIGSVSKIKNFKNDYVLLTNSDLLTNINYEDFFLEFIKQDADFAVLTIPYQIDIPYAILETLNGNVKSFKEKPKYTFESNGGVYLMKKEIINLIPKNKFYDTTDLMTKLIKEKYKIISYPFTGYWLDIGKHEDYERAKKDILKINFL